MREGVTTGLLAGSGIVGVVVGWLLTRVWYVRAGLPPIPSPLAAVLLAVVAAALIALALPVRAAAHSDRIPSRAVSPRRAIGVLALAQASAVTGSALAGWNLGFLGALIGDLDAASVRSAAATALAHAAAAACLLGAGLWAQNSCRLPPGGPAPGSTSSG